MARASPLRHFGSAFRWPWRQYGDGPTRFEAGQFHDTDAKPYTAEDFRFTTKSDVLYAIELGRPKSGEAVIHALAAAVGTRNVAEERMPGDDRAPTFEQRADGLHIRVPASPFSQYAYTYRISWR